MTRSALFFRTTGRRYERPFSQPAVGLTVVRAMRCAIAFVMVAAVVGACGAAGGEPVAAPARPSAARPASTSTPISAPTLVTPAPFVQRVLSVSPLAKQPALRLSGGGAGLPAVAAGVPFDGHLLISDVGNKRIVEIAPSGELTWSFPAAGDAAAAALGPWDDAHYAPDGKTVVANSAATSTVIAIDVATRQIRWQAGTPGRPGRGATAFNSPDDIVTALDGTSYFADILNCRVVQLSASGEFVRAIGDGRCVHDPPKSLASPNGAYPTADGDLIITEITGSWITRLGADGAVRWAVRSPLTYPSDAMAYPDGSVLVSDYVSPGQVVRMAPDGKVIWRYDAARQLKNPSSAVPLAANRVAISDDFAGRVLIVDPTTNEIVKEYTTVGGVRMRITDCVSYRPD